jgi:hypothetical protein
MILKSEELWNATIMTSGIAPSTLDFVDCAGISWPPNSFPIIPPKAENQELFYPREGDGFRAGKIEWDALSISVFIARNYKPLNETVLAIELGASAAPWALTFLKHVTAKTNRHVTTIAIEAGNVKKITQLFWSRNELRFRKTLGLSKFTFRGKQFTSIFLKGIATNSNGKMYFPRVNISKDNGATGARELSKLDRRGKLRFNRVPAIDTLKLIEEKKMVCLLHMDVQGAEVEIMQDPRFGASIQKVQVLLIGTHSLVADELAEGIDGKYGLTLLAGKRMKPGGPNGEWPVDGEFLFVNQETLNLLSNSGYLLAKK